MEFTGIHGRMHYEVAGDGDKTLLLLHGWGGSTESWIPVIRDFSKRMRVIAVDFPGFGKSGEPDKGWSVTEYASLLIEFLQNEIKTPVNVMAHSFGGRVALLVGKTAPELIEKQVLTGCAGLPPKKSLLGKAAGGMFHMLSGALDNRFTRRLAGDERIDKSREAVRNLFGSSDYKNASPAMKETFKLVISQDLSDCLPAIKAPTLLIWGENDTATPVWMGQTMEKEIRDAGLVVFEGAGHFAYLEQYARFKAISETFLLG